MQKESRIMEDSAGREMIAVGERENGVPLLIDVAAKRNGDSYDIDPPGKIRE